MMMHNGEMMGWGGTMFFGPLMMFFWLAVLVVIAVGLFRLLSGKSKTAGRARAIAFEALRGR